MNKTMTVENQERTHKATISALINSSRPISAITREIANTLNIAETGVLPMSLDDGRVIQAKFGNVFLTIDGQTFNTPVWIEAACSYIGFNDLQVRGSMLQDLVKLSEPKKKLPFAHPVPQFIIQYPATIEKHYLDYKAACETGTVRVVKPEKDILLYRCLPPGHKWVIRAGRASPPKGAQATLVKTIVPNTPKYQREVEYWEGHGIPVKREGKQEGIEPKVAEPDPEMDQVKAALSTAEVVE